MRRWLEELAEAAAQPRDAVLVTVAGVRGSAPREVGARMLVTRTDSRGTIGGGTFEYQCLKLAARQLADGATRGALRRFPLGSDCGQCCGGVVDVLLEPLAGIACLDALLDAWRTRRAAVLVTTMGPDGLPRKALVHADGTPGDDTALPAAALAAARELLAGQDTARRVDTPGRRKPFLLLEALRGPRCDVAVFGAGHVGSALVGLLAGLDCSLRWIDSRRGVLPRTLPAGVQRIESADPAREVAALPPGTFCFVMTHSHALDFDITAAALGRSDLAYVGLIGSATKRRRFERRLQQQGLDAAALDRLTCPIGIAGISGKEPQEIAIAAAAELLRLRERLAAGPRATASVHALPRHR